MAMYGGVAGGGWLDLTKMVGVEIPNIYCKMNYINKLQYNKVHIH